MSRIQVLFFAADPLSTPSHGHARLKLDEDVRQTDEKVRAAEYRDALQFDRRWAVRTDDLLQALYEVRPQVVHFSGHGSKEGLVLVSADGRGSHFVPAETLARLFKAFRGDIRLVVLNACMSAPQAKAIAEVVGCAIGTARSISDDAAITFGASFYRAIAFGQSVQAAFEQACVALALEYPQEQDTPRLVVRDDVDPAKLFLVPPHSAAPCEAPPEAAPARTERRAGPEVAPPAPPRSRLASWWAGAAAAVVAISSGAVLALTQPAGTLRPRSLFTAPISTAEQLARAKTLHTAGDHAAAFPLFESAAKAGNAEAKGYLGAAYLKGQGTVRQPDLGIHWLREAGQARDAYGMHQLGTAYQRGDGVRQSDRYALHWYRVAAAETRYAPAMSHLAAMHLRGRGTAQSYDSALVWYRRAAAAGDVDARVDVGTLVARGLGSRRDPAQALRLYREAADAGSARGMFAMGMAYQEGVIAPRDYTQARAWYLKAVGKNLAAAMNNLGVLYHNGWGVPADPRKASRWFRRAVDAGSLEAVGNLAALES